MPATSAGDMTWLIAADRGGTFTDCLGIDPQGRRHRRKLLSSGRLRGIVSGRTGARELALTGGFEVADGFFAGWTLAVYPPGSTVPAATGPVAGSAENGARIAADFDLPEEAGSGWVAELFTGEPAPVTGVRLLTGTRLREPFPPLEFRLATTLATNALLENKSADVALFITTGFRDLPEIGDQRRPDLFARGHRRERPACRTVVEVTGRLDAAGREIAPLDAAEVGESARRLVANGIRTAAVALAHSYRNPSHERTVRDILQRAGFTSVSLSAEVAPLIRLLPRAGTAIVNAALSPVIDSFTRSVRDAMPSAALLMVTSAGGLDKPEKFLPRDSLLSGPAGGVAGCAAIARRAGYSRILTFDMGGTSTDVSRWEGDFLYRFEQRCGQAVILAPSLRIETVAAGGGSICDVTPEGLTVGPQSAGADPGPACYGRGGPLTLTDVNLLLGRIDPARTAIPLDPAPARRALEALKRKMADHGLPVPENDADLLNGLLDIAVDRMAEAIRGISVRDGCNPSDYALVAFGGAGPQHACAVADRLGITTILIPEEAGLLSAAGAAGAVLERFVECQVLEPLDQPDRFAARVRELESDALARLGRPGGIRRRIAEVRMRGQESSLALDFETPGDLPEAFAGEFRRLFGYAPPAGRTLELVSLRVIASTPAPDPGRESFPSADGESLSGPVLLQDGFSTLVLEEGWTAVRGDRGTQRLHRTGTGTRAAAPEAEAAAAAVFTGRFQAIAAAMGDMLRRTAVSTNVRERLDFSCAILDDAGRLLVNAPHIPVHLGALGECVRRTAAAISVEPGDVLVTNDPAFGGSHLPDVTVMCPVFGPSGSLLAWTANRAHHAEIGGSAPGSMPAEARCLAEEGVVIPPAWLVRKGRSCEDEIAGRLTSAPWPTRALADNLADLRAQTAAARYGAEALLHLCTDHGEDTVRRRLAGLTATARNAFAHALASRPVSAAEAAESLDDGTPIAVSLTQSGERLVIDFAGSGPVHPGNRNAPPAVVRSAVLYALRLWIGEDIPLNEGILDLVDIRIPAGLLNPPFADEPSRSPAVAGGNVETSQRVVDLLVRILNLEAGSQGTMNNVLFGSERFGHYETVCGGAGAGPGYHGTAAIHTHMTNTAITDIEILEHRYPVRVREFAIRRGSGGDGQWRGGDGAIRTWEFLEPLTISLLTEHRIQGPLGLHGGRDGLPGRQMLHLPDGSCQPLPGTATVRVAAGTILRMETPGGAGWGIPVPPP